MMLDGDLGERAVKNCKEFYEGEDYLIQKRESVSRALHGAFPWSETNESHGFWEEVYDDLVEIGL